MGVAWIHRSLIGVFSTFELRKKTFNLQNLAPLSRRSLNLLSLHQIIKSKFKKAPNMLLLPVLAQQQPGCNVSSISSSNFSKFVTTSFSSNKTSNGHKSYAFTCQSSSTSSSSASLATLQQKQKHFQNNIQTAAVFSGQVPRRPTSARQKLKVAVDVDEGKIFFCLFGGKECVVGWRL